MEFKERVLKENGHTILTDWNGEKYNWEMDENVVRSPLLISFNFPKSSGTDRRSFSGRDPIKIGAAGEVFR